MENVKVINKFDSIVVGGLNVKTFFSTPNGTQFVLTAKGLNVYGNPTYHLHMEPENMLKIKNRKNRLGRVILNKKTGQYYLTFNSYNVASSMKYLFKLCEIEAELV